MIQIQTAVICILISNFCNLIGFNHLDKFKYILLLGFLVSTSALAQDNQPPEIDLPAPTSGTDDNLMDPLLGTADELGAEKAAEAIAAPALPSADQLLSGQPVKQEDKQILDKAIKEVFEEPQAEKVAEPKKEEAKIEEVKQEEKPAASPAIAPEDDLGVTLTVEGSAPEAEAPAIPVEPAKAEEKPATAPIAEQKIEEKKEEAPVTTETEKTVEVKKEEAAQVAPEKFLAEPKQVAPVPEAVIPAESPKSVRESYESNFDTAATPTVVSTPKAVKKQVVRKKVTPSSALPSGIYLLNDAVPNAPKVNVPVHVQQPVNTKPKSEKVKKLPNSMKHSAPVNVSPSTEVEEPLVETPFVSQPRQLPDSMKQGSIESDDLDLVNYIPSKKKKLKIKEDIVIDRGDFSNPFPDAATEEEPTEALAETTISKKKDTTSDESGAPVVDFSDTEPADFPEKSNEQSNNFYMMDAGLQVEVKDAPKNSGGAMKNAYDALQVGQYESAINYYNDALQIAPNNRKALFGLATAYHMNKQYTQAREYYLKLIKLDPDYWPAVNNYIIMVTEENPEKSIEKLEDLYSRNPTFAGIPAQIGSLYFKKGNLKRSAEYYTNAVKLEPTNIDYRYNLAVILEKAGNYNDAATIYGTLLEDASKGAKLPEDPSSIKDRFDDLISKK